jgi:hypothetical protein
VYGRGTRPIDAKVTTLAEGGSVADIATIAGATSRPKLGDLAQALEVGIFLTDGVDLVGDGFNGDSPSALLIQRIR